MFIFYYYIKNTEVWFLGSQLAGMNMVQQSNRLYKIPRHPLSIKRHDFIFNTIITKTQWDLFVLFTE